MVYSKNTKTQNFSIIVKENLIPKKGARVC